MIIAQVIKESDNEFPTLTHDLKVGDIYEVEHIEMSASYTNVYLKGKDFPYNSVIFKFYETQDLDIYSNPKYNPYLQ